MAKTNTARGSASDTEGCDVSQKGDPRQRPLALALEGMGEWESLHHPCIAYPGFTLVTLFVCWAGDKDTAMS